MSKDEDNNEMNKIQVCVRIRPSKTTLEQQQQPEHLVTYDNRIEIKEKNYTAPKLFEYDSIFDSTANQKEVYNQLISKNDLFHKLQQGINVTLLVYGQSGSGKTFTIGTSSSSQISRDELIVNQEEKKADHVDTVTSTTDERRDSSSNSSINSNTGIIPRTIFELFQKLNIQDQNSNIQITMSFLEIYNEELRDLLSSTNSLQDLKIREEGPCGVQVSNLTQNPVVSFDQVMAYLSAASQKRITATTNLNSVSSRSHAICTFTILHQNQYSKLTFVDLAGSERAKKSKCIHTRFQEGIQINKGLLVLGQVISALSSKEIHVPFRDSKLTRLLQESLGGNSHTIMIACVSSDEDDIKESVNTLRYASRARAIENTVLRNVIVKEISLEEGIRLKRENEVLKIKLRQYEKNYDGFQKRQNSNYYDSSEAFLTQEQDNHQESITSQSLLRKLKFLEKQVQILQKDLRQTSQQSQYWQNQYQTLSYKQCCSCLDIQTSQRYLDYSSYVQFLNKQEECYLDRFSFTRTKKHFCDWYYVFIITLFLGFAVIQKVQNDKSSRPPTSLERRAQCDKRKVKPSLQLSSFKIHDEKQALLEKISDLEKKLKLSKKRRSSHQFEKVENKNHSLQEEIADYKRRNVLLQKKQKADQKQFHVEKQNLLKINSKLSRDIQRFKLDLSKTKEKLEKQSLVLRQKMQIKRNPSFTGYSTNSSFRVRQTSLATSTSMNRDAYSSKDDLIRDFEKDLKCVREKKQRTLTIQKRLSYLECKYLLKHSFDLVLKQKKEFTDALLRMCSNVDEKQAIEILEKDTVVGVDDGLKLVVNGFIMEHVRKSIDGNG